MSSFPCGKESVVTGAGDEMPWSKETKSGPAIILYKRLGKVSEPYGFSVQDFELLLKYFSFQSSSPGSRRVTHK
jgi:hypothetical protein